MMNILTKKRGKKGFTLMELLIVVAIIAILVAISIPVFSSQLEKAREATDVANVRAAKACAVTKYLTNDENAADKLDFEEVSGESYKAATLYYDADNGTLVTTKPSTGYGKGTSANGGIDSTDDHSGQVIEVKIKEDGTVSTDWVAKKGS